MEEPGIGFGQHQLDGEVIQYLSVVIAFQIGRTKGGRQLVGERLVGVIGSLNGLRIEARAIAERHVLAQVKGVLQRVLTDVPAFCQPGNDVASLRFLIGQRLGDVTQHHPVLQPVHLERVKADQRGVVSEKSDLECLASLAVLARR
ncbi:hypothetical protein ALP64_205192 [Pseudomonas syringae pv. actinidiae]|nr:hypothetical protein ALP64_205192 [Pseudomonas syringae pv. actinidiae]